MKLKATDDFFDKLGRMIDEDSHGYHKCRDCGVVDGGLREIKHGKRRGQKGQVPAIVRLCLIDPKGSDRDINNVGYYCTKCRKGPRESKGTPKAVRDKLPKLFE